MAHSSWLHGFCKPPIVSKCDLGWNPYASPLTLSRLWKDGRGNLRCKLCLDWVHVLCRLVQHSLYCEICCKGEPKKDLFRVQGWDSQSIFSSYLGMTRTKIRRQKCFVNPSPDIHAMFYGHLPFPLVRLALTKIASNYRAHWICAPGTHFITAVWPETI